MELSIRLTTETATHDEIAKILDPLSDKYIIALEQANSRHFQCYINYIVNDDPKYNKLRYTLKKEGYEGNAKLSITKQKSKNLQIYVLKEGNYIYKGFTQEEIDELASQSYEKPLSYKKQKQQLSQLYLDGNLTETMLIANLLQLIGEHSIEFYQHKVLAYVRGLKLKKDPEKYLVEQTKSILEKLYSE